ncbi:unnamed protein product [Moneuplotes crassus]|uniref:Uncharacterized protein n=1 Tax=Euplotes crassus TaxID=5936 RepID=A0AAD1U3A9_EUPCR|nr:unnamed protein product [Moneuplotes crassus]
MKFPKCQAKGCKNRSIFYLTCSGKYVCSDDKAARYNEYAVDLDEECIPLITPEPVKALLRTINQCRKELEFSPFTFGHLSTPEEYEGLNLTIKGHIEDILIQLEAAQRKKTYYMFECLLQQAKKVEKILTQDKIFQKYAVIKLWKEAESAITGDLQVNSASISEQLIEESKNPQNFLLPYNFQSNPLLEEILILQRSKHLSHLEQTVSQLKTQRRGVQSDHQKLISELQSKRTRKKLKIRNLRLNLKAQIKEKSKAQEEYKNSLKSKQRDIAEMQKVIGKLEEESKKSEIENFRLKQSISDGIETLKRERLENQAVRVRDNILYQRAKQKLLFVIDEYTYTETSFLYKHINSLLEESSIVKDFLQFYFPKNLDGLNFNDNSILSDELDEYANQLVEVSSRVGIEVRIANFKISQENLIALLSAYKHKRSFTFDSCILDLSSVPCFLGALKGCLIQELYLTGCGHCSRSDWAEQPSQIENLVAGLAQEEDLKESLKVIGLEKCGIEQEKAEQIVKENGLEDVIVLMW